MELFLNGVLTCAYFQSRLAMIVFVPKVNSEESGFMIAIVYLLFVPHYINHVKPVLRMVVKPAGQNLLMPVLQSYFSLTFTLTVAIAVLMPSPTA